MVVITNLLSDDKHLKLILSGWSFCSLLSQLQTPAFVSRVLGEGLLATAGGHLIPRYVLVRGRPPSRQSRCPLLGEMFISSVAACRLDDSE